MSCIQDIFVHCINIDASKSAFIFCVVKSPLLSVLRTCCMPKCYSLMAASYRSLNAFCNLCGKSQWLSHTCNYSCYHSSSWNRSLLLGLILRRDMQNKSQARHYDFKITFKNRIIFIINIKLYIKILPIKWFAFCISNSRSKCDVVGDSINESILVMCT